MTRFAAARQVLERAIEAHVCPAAVVEVGEATRPIWREAFGRLSHAGDAPRTREDTIFDLASLTKVVCTATLVMRQVERGRLALDDRVRDCLAGWHGGGRDGVTLRDLLAHCAGLPAYRPLYQTHQGARAFEGAICETPLEYAPRTRAVYSDLGFMLLGFVLERTGPLPVQFDALREQLGPIQELQFHPPAAWRPRIAPTEHDPWRGRLLVGEVHDENAWALGGAAAHAGLFGTAGAVGDFARHVLQVLDGRRGAMQQATLREVVTRHPGVPGSSRALGWDTMVPTSSCGTRMSPRAFGHTGFTGTSLWIDPDAGVYVVLLTNRVHPTRTNEAIRQLRPALHDAVMREVEDRTPLSGQGRLPG
jgi:serine-type D-Ala-D-Ala carboxypeptidase